MCYRLVERYSVCRCFYYKHGVDMCSAANQRGHKIVEKTIYVGYLCSHHTSWDDEGSRKDKDKKIGSDDGSRTDKPKKPQLVPSPAKIATDQWNSPITPVSSGIRALIEGRRQPTVAEPLQSQIVDTYNHNSANFLPKTKDLKDALEVFSDTESLTSLEESLFSSRTRSSSVSSVMCAPGADDMLFVLLMTDELQDFYDAITKAMPINIFEKRLRGLLRKLSLDLRVQSSNEQEKRAAKFIRYRARNFAHRISRIIEKGNSVKSMLLSDENIPEEEDFEDAEFDNVAEGPLDIQELETFVAASVAFANFRAILEELKPANSESKLSPEYFVDTTSAEESEPPHYRKTGVLWEKNVDIAWKCHCGMAFTETITEYQPGAAKALANEINQNNPVDVEGLAGIHNSSASSLASDQSSGRPSRRSGFSKSEKTIRAETPDDRLELEQRSSLPYGEYILFCRQKGTEIKLQHAEITANPCDHSSYSTLHDRYFGRLHKYFHWITLTEISSVDFVKFYLYWATNVSIDPSDIGALPPIPSTEYAYTSNTNPPVPRTALQHFLQHPSHAPRCPRHRPRIPKKLGRPLELGDDAKGERQGYGLYVREQICWARVLVFEAVFAVVCAVVAVAWCVLNEGGVQDWCAIAGTGLAYTSIGLGTLQVALQAGRIWL